MQLSRVLVVGFGFLGRRVAGALQSSGYKIRVLAGSAPSPDALGIPVVLGDAADRHAAERAVDGCDVVVWCAGRLLPASTVQELAQIDDVGPLHTVLTELGERGGKRFIYLSSGGTVYGDAQRIPTPETEPLRPISIYGATKVRCEQYVRELSDHEGIAATILRCGNVYGPGQRAGRSQGVVANALACQRAGRPLALFADPWSTRDYTFVDDVVGVIEACLVAKPPDVMNVATGIGTPLLELIQLIQGITGGPDVVSRPPRQGDVARSVLDISRLRAFVPGFAPVSLESGIELTTRELAALVTE